VRHLAVPPKARAVIRPSLSSAFSNLLEALAALEVGGLPGTTRFQGTPQKASWRISMGAASAKSRATSWSQPQSEPLTVSMKCTSGQSPSPMAQLPNAACMPPWAAEEWERRAGTIESTDDVESGAARLDGHAFTGRDRRR
jgi:hypothetical protein